MNDIMVAVLMAVLAILCFTVYIFCIRDVFPKYILKRKYFMDKHLGRGLAKYTSSDGRAVVYEPHPSVRKYIKKYALVEREGHKYLECSIDSAVKKISYTVIMLNNKDEIIDVLKVNDITVKMTVTHPVYLHADTSYIALLPESVNGAKLSEDGICYYRARDIALFSLAMSVLSFIEYSLLSLQLDVFLKRVTNEVSNTAFRFSTALALSLLIGVISAAVIFLHCSKKNMKVTFHDR